jgi:hypothetical protein
MDETTLTVEQARDDGSVWLTFIEMDGTMRQARGD